VYDEDPSVDPSTEIESKEMQLLPDNAQYEGQWNKASGERHGRGY